MPVALGPRLLLLETGEEVPPVVESGEFVGDREPRHLFVHQDPLEDGRRLRRDEREETEVFLGERLVLRMAQVEHADQLLLHDERHGEERTDVRPDRPRSAVELVEEDRLLLLRDPRGEAEAVIERNAADEVDVVTEDGADDELLGSAVEDEERSVLVRDDLADQLHELVQRLFPLVRRLDESRDFHQDLQLLSLARTGVTLARLENADDLVVESVSCREDLGRSFLRDRLVDLLEERCPLPLGEIASVLQHLDQLRFSLAKLLGDVLELLGSVAVSPAHVPSSVPRPPCSVASASLPWA